MNDFVIITGSIFIVCVVIIFIAVKIQGNRPKESEFNGCTSKILIAVLLIGVLSFILTLGALNRSSNGDSSDGYNTLNEDPRGR